MREPESDKAQRKPYSQPKLVDYGKIEKLTQSAGNTTLDHGSSRKTGA